MINRREILACGAATALSAFHRPQMPIAHPSVGHTGTIAMSDCSGRQLTMVFKDGLCVGYENPEVRRMSK